SVPLPEHGRARGEPALPAIGANVYANGIAARADPARAPAAEALPPTRVIIESLEPEIDGRRFPIKRVVRDEVGVAAGLFAEGHELVGGAVLQRCGKGAWSEARMQPLGNDRFCARFTVDRCGVYEYAIEAWVDRFGSWRRGLSRKVDAGAEV